MEKDAVQKDLEGKDTELSGKRGLMLAFVVSDIISHDKGEKKSICLFAEVRKDKQRLFTINLNINNLKKEGMDYLAKVMGAKIALKTPLMGEIFIAEGEILDHWANMRPEEKEE